MRYADRVKKGEVPDREMEGSVWDKFGMDKGRTCVGRDGVGFGTDRKGYGMDWNG